MSSQGDVVAEVSSLGDVLRAVHPSVYDKPPLEIRTAVAGALNWFVVEAPQLARNYCDNLIPQLSVPELRLAEVTVDRAGRPATFRRHVTALRDGELGRDREFVDYFNALPEQRRVAAFGDHTRHESPVTINRGLLGPLLSDFVYMRSWLSSHGSKAGYWAYRYVGGALHYAAAASTADRKALAVHLIESSDRTVCKYVAPVPNAPARNTMTRRLEDQ